MYGLIRPARLARVIDGDTQDLVLYLGDDIVRRARVRLYGVDAAEIFRAKGGAAEVARGREQLAWVVAWYEEAARWAADDWPLLVESSGRGKFGRIVAEVTRKLDRASLNSAVTAQFPDAQEPAQRRPA